MRKASEALLNKLRAREEFRAAAYPDQGGKWTIGYGTTTYPKSGQREKVQQGDTCTREEAEAWFRLDVAAAERIVAKSVEVELTQAQFDALIMFAYNTGSLGTTLKQRLNSGDFAGAVKAMREWIYVTDKKTKRKFVSAGLVARRNEEISLFTAV